MKKIRCFLLALFVLISTTYESKAFTASIKKSFIAQQANDLNPQNQENILLLSSILDSSLEFSELNFSSSNSVRFLENKLTILYSICIALVLFNLIAQVKIIYQMIHLFFLFKKKDEFASFEF